MASETVLYNIKVIALLFMKGGGIMPSLISMILMLIIFCAGFALMAAVLIQHKTPRYWGLVIGAVLILMPLVWIFDIRAGNAADGEVDTGTLIEWETEDESFEYQGQHYQKLHLTIGDAEPAIYFDGRETRAATRAVFNITAEINVLERLFNAEDKDTIFFVNDNLLADWGGYYVSDGNMKRVKAYYEDRENYDFYPAEHRAVSKDGLVEVKGLKQELK